MEGRDFDIDAAVLREPVGDILYFAGEATSQTGWASTTVGAYETGRDVAKAIAKNKGKDKKDKDKDKKDKDKEKKDKDKDKEKKDKDKDKDKKDKDKDKKDKDKDKDQIRARKLR